MNETWSTQIQGIDTLNLNRQIRLNDKTFRSILKVMDLDESDSILELGCGPGTFTRRLASFFPKMSISGLDFDDGFIDYCKQEADKLAYGNLTYLQGNALKTAFEDDTFDVCTSHTVIEHLPNHDFLKEQYRILRPGGKVVVFNTRADVALRSSNKIDASEREKELLDKVGDTLQEIQEKNQVGQYTSNPQDIMKTMEHVGFHELQIDVIPYVICLDDCRNDLDYKIEILESERKSLLEFINMALSENPTTLSGQELKELLSLIDERFSKRIDMINEGEKVWDLDIAPTLVIIGKKSYE